MELWKLTYIQYCNHFLENNKYKNAYKSNPEKWESKKKDLLKDWENVLLERAEVGNIPEVVIRSYVKMFGEPTTRRIFRGTKGKGLEEWEQTQIKKALRENILDNQRKCENNYKYKSCS